MMERTQIAQIAQKIIEIMRKVLELPEETEITSKVLEIDSLTLVKILIELELEFSIEFDDTDLFFDNFKDLDNYIDIVVKKMN